MRAFDDGLPVAPPIAITGILAPERPAPVHQTQETPPSENPLDALSSCRYCWGQHPGACPFIKLIEWHPGGTVARIVLKERPEHEKQVIYPGDAAADQTDALRRALAVIVEATTLKHARELAVALIALLDEEKPG